MLAISPYNVDRGIEICRGNLYTDPNGREDLQDGGDRAPFDAVFRGRSDSPPLYGEPRPDRRDREGRPQDEVAVRRPAGAVVARRVDAARGRGRAADDHGRRAPALPPRD